MSSIASFLNSTDFYSYSGISSSDVNTSYANFLISQINGLVSQKLGRLFQFASFTSKYYLKNSNIIIPVEFWQPSGVLASFTITNGGSGYTTAPTVTLSGNATAEAVVTGGVVTAINVTYQGYGYTAAPSVSFSGGGGTNAAATANLSSLVVKKGSDDSETLETLTENTSYRVIYFQEQEPSRRFPVVAIKLYDDYLPQGGFLELTGTFGYSPKVPSEIMLDYQLYDLLKKAVLAAEAETDSVGKGKITSSKIDKIQTSFDIDSVYSVRESISTINQLLDGIISDYDVLTSGYLPSIIG